MIANYAKCSYRNTQQLTVNIETGRDRSIEHVRVPLALSTTRSEPVSSDRFESGLLVVPMHNAHVKFCHFTFPPRS